MGRSNPDDLQGATIDSGYHHRPKLRQRQPKPSDEGQPPFRPLRIHIPKDVLDHPSRTFEKSSRHLVSASSASTCTRDSGYISDTFNLGSGEPQLANTFNKKPSYEAGPPAIESPNHSTFNFAQDIIEQHSAHLRTQHLPSVGIADEPIDLGTVQEIEYNKAIPSSNNSIIFETCSTDSISNDRYASRSPSPWQVTNNAESMQSFAQTLCWIIGGMSDSIPSSQLSVNSSPGNSARSVPTTFPIDESITRTAGSTSQSSVNVAHSSIDSAPGQTTASFRHGSLKRSRAPTEPDRNSDDENSDEPNQKRMKLVTQEPQLSRPRFACPYQKFDPVGSPFCCMPSNKNPEGGADTFPRVKSHVFRNHDPFIRCNNCWKTCKDEHEATMHKKETDCIPGASPGKYWMTKLQRDEVRRRKFRASPTDKWFCLFDILLPHILADGPNGYKKLSPYYIVSLAVPITPAHSSSSGHPSILGRRAEPTFPSIHQVLDSPDERQPIATFSPGNANGDTVLTDFLDAIDTNSSLFSPLSGIDPDSTINGSLNLSIQPHHSGNSGAQGNVVDTNLPSWPRPSIDHNPFPSLESNLSTNTNIEFLRQDNIRLRNNNTQLQDEIENLRVQQIAYQARLNDLQERLWPLDRSLENLLYLPGVQNDGGGLSKRLFAILEQMTAMRKSLSAGINKG